MRVFAALATLVAATAVVATSSEALADASASTVVGWGDNDWGQLSPPAVSSPVTAVAAGGSHTLALEADGTVAAWGNDTSGQTSIPDGLGAVTQVAAGRLHSLALTDVGSVVAWGDDTDGQASVPPGLTNVSRIAAGGFHSLALKTDGTVVAWGDDTYGQSSVPPRLTNVIQVAAGGFHSLALKADGTVVAWGDDTYGQSSVPPGLTNVIQVSAGGFHSLALKADGTVVAWGDNPYGGTTIPAGLNGVTQVSAGGRHSVALVVDRAVVGFRDSSVGRAENAGLAEVIATRTGSTDTAASADYAPTGGTAEPGVDFLLDPGVVTFAPGQMTAAIPILILDDSRPEPSETIIITLGDPGPGTSIGSPAAVTLTIAASDQPPDLLISTHLASGYIGNNVYSDDPAVQTRTRRARRGATRRLYVRIYDDGNATDTFTLHGSAASRGSSVRYTDTELGFNVTNAMRSPTGWQVTLTARHYVQLTVRMTVASTARIGSIKSVNITSSWTGDRTRTDAVRARLRVVRPRS